MSECPINLLAMLIGTPALSRSVQYVWRRLYMTKSSASGKGGISSSCSTRHPIPIFISRRISSHMKRLRPIVGDLPSISVAGSNGSRLQLHSSFRKISGIGICRKPASDFGYLERPFLSHALETVRIPVLKSISFQINAADSLGRRPQYRQNLQNRFPR